MMIQKRGPMHPVQLWTCVVAVGWLSVAMLPQVCQAAEAHDDPAKALVTPQVFQAAGPAPKDADKKTITMRFRARSMRSVRRWETPTTAMPPGQSPRGAARSTGMAAARWT